MVVNDSLMREGATGNYIRVNRVQPRGSTEGNGSSSGGKATTGDTGGKKLSQDEIDARIETAAARLIKMVSP